MEVFKSAAFINHQSNVIGHIIATPLLLTLLTINVRLTLGVNVTRSREEVDAGQQIHQDGLQEPSKSTQTVDGVGILSKPAGPLPPWIGQ